MASEVSPVHGPGQPPAGAELRASHSDRDRVVEILRVAAGDGRLTAEELDERLEAALTARTYRELAVLTADLPAEAQPAAAPALPPVAAKDVVSIDAFGGNAGRTGTWVVPHRMEVKVTGGNVRLDLTQAVITHPDLQVEASVRGGNMIIVTRPGVVVDTDEVAVRGGNIRARAHPGPPAPVVLRVRVAGTVSGGNLITRPPRRTFWPWLARKPLPYS